MYKYPFAEQLMIYAQRHDAHICVELETWNNKLNRWVNKGAKGIALIDDSGDKPRLKYVFDISDTHASRNANPNRPYIWEMKPEHEGPVIDALAQAHEDLEGDLPAMLYQIAQQMAQEYFVENHHDIAEGVWDSHLEDYGEEGALSAFNDAVAVSTAYTLMARCGIDPDEHLSHEDFMGVFDCNTESSVYALGAAVSELSEKVLREIEVAVKQYERENRRERSQQHEQSDLHNQRGLPSAGRDIAADAVRSGWEVWQNEEEPSETAPAHPVQPAAADRDVAPTPDGDRPDSHAADGTDDGRTGAEDAAARQEQQPDGVDGPHEQPETHGGGNDSGGTDLQLEPDASPPGADFAEDREDSLSSLLLASSLTTEQVDGILRAGGNTNKSTLRIVTQYMLGKSPEEIMDFLRDEYRKGGHGFQFGTDPVAAWFDEIGMTFGAGRSALQVSDSIHLSWAQVENRIRTLMESGQYLPQDELDMALDNQFQETAESLLYFYMDDLREVPASFDVNGNGFPDRAATVKAMLQDPEQLAQLQNALLEDIEVARLRVLKGDYQSQIFNMEDNLLRYFPESIKRTTEMMAGLEHDQSTITAETKPNKDGFSSMVIEGITFAEKEGAGKALLEACKNVTVGDPVKIGSYRGLDLHLTFNSLTKEFECTLKGDLSYKATLGTDVFGNIPRLNNVIDEQPKRLASGKNQLDNLTQQMETARVEVEKPFAYASELEEKEARLTFLNAQLDMGDKQSELSGQITAGESAAQQARASDGPVQKPSILEGLRVAAAEIREQDAAASRPDPAKYNDIAI